MRKQLKRHLNIILKRFYKIIIKSNGGTTMTPFEIIILAIYYLFAWAYMTACFGVYDDDITWKDRLLLVLVSGTIGVIQFPMAFALHIWKKLNN